MKAMVLAAGFSTRLLPLTAVVSKVSLSLVGVPVLVRVLRWLRSCGVAKFVVNLHHAPESVKDCLAGHGEQVVFSPEEKILGTAGGLRRAAGNFSGGTFLMVNGDCLYRGCPLDQALEFHRKQRAMATMVLTDMPEGASYGRVETDSGGRLLRIAGRPGNSSIQPARSLHFTGIHILEPELLAELPEGFSDINRDVYPRLIAEGFPLFGFHTAFRWFDLGTPRRFLEAAFYLLETGGKTQAPSGVLVGEGCRIDPSARLRGPLDLGVGCVVGRRAEVAMSVLGSGVRVGPGAVVEECLVGDGVEVGAGAGLSRCAAAVVEGVLQTRSWEP